MEYLCRRLGKQKIYIVGHSWGSILGVLLAQKHSGALSRPMSVMGQFCRGVEKRAADLMSLLLWPKRNAWATGAP